MRDMLETAVLAAAGLAMVLSAALTVRSIFEMRRDDRRPHDDHTGHSPV